MDSTSKPSGATTGLPATLLSKAWAEKTVDEKLDALREELMGARYTTRRVATLEKRVNLLQSHSHDQHGRTLIDMGFANIHDYPGDIALRSHDPLA